MPKLIEIGGCTKTPETLEEKGNILLADIYDVFEKKKQDLIELEKKKIYDERGKEPYKPPVKKNQDVL